MSDVMRFSPEQLGRLQEVASSVDCECPNHLATLVTSLQSFESYSARCKNKDDKDAAIHAMLHRETQRARVIMEDALSRLLVHEGMTP